MKTLTLLLILSCSLVFGQKKDTVKWTYQHGDCPWTVDTNCTIGKKAFKMRVDRIKDPADTNWLSSKQFKLKLAPDTAHQYFGGLIGNHEINIGYFEWNWEIGPLVLDTPKSNKDIWQITDKASDYLFQIDTANVMTFGKAMQLYYYQFNSLEKTREVKGIRWLGFENYWYIDNPANHNGNYILHLKRSRIRWVNDTTAIYYPVIRAKKRRKHHSKIHGSKIVYSPSSSPDPDYAIYKGQKYLATVTIKNGKVIALKVK